MGDAPTIEEVRKALHAASDDESAAFLRRYFKCGPGEYAEGDRFMGIRVPDVRRVVRQARHLPLSDIITLLRSEWHEERLLALFVMVEQHRRGNEALQIEIFQKYLSHTEFINNWDLVDASAGPIVGPHIDPDRPELLERLARSGSLWERRVAIMATFYWTKQGRLEPTLRIAELLVDDQHDLIHKAVGWMLREVGKRDRSAEEAFLRVHHRTMPRTMLRYAIEHFPEARRQQLLRGDF